MMAERTGNRLLDRLPEDELKLLSSWKSVSFSHGQIVFQQDGPASHVYSPTTSVLGVVVTVEEGKQVEGTTVGKEGMVGLPVFLGVDFHPFRAMAQVSGTALQLPANLFKQAVKPNTTLDRLMRRYILYRLRCADQMGACNTLHAVEERMARWLLMSHDRAGQDDFYLTHEFLSELLGVRRQTVSITAGMLQEAGFIAYRRGLLHILDREGLEATSCECYGALKQLYNRIVGGKSPQHS
jgi:CRP-like cAMP-binding protein